MQRWQIFIETSPDHVGEVFDFHDRKCMMPISIALCTITTTIDLLHRLRRLRWKL